MDRNQLLRSIKRACGFKYFKSGYDTEDIIEIINDEALPLFEKYIRPYVRLRVSKKEGSENSFIIDPENKLEYCKIYDLKPMEDYFYEFDGYGKNNMPMQSMVGGDMTSVMIGMEMESEFHVEPRFDFIPPNTLTVSKFSGGHIPDELDMFYFYVAQPKNLSQIPPQAEQIFKELCIACVKKALYDELIFIKNMNNPNGSIELPVDNWSGAVDKIKELEEELKNMRFEYEFHIYVM